jgi:CheY-like chemotaxis protein
MKINKSVLQRGIILVLCSCILFSICPVYAFAAENQKERVVRIGVPDDTYDKIYDMILMDIQMPNMDGYEATKCIRHLQDIKKAEIPIIAMTANAFREDKEKCLAAGMNAHLAKPLDIEKMEQTICKQLRDAKIEK